jgi:lipoate-protein ligase A
MEIELRIDAPFSGTENMAIDEELLERASENAHVQIRLYRWCEPTLSLGHFQSIEDLAGDPSVIASGRLEQLADLPRVRRRTGGGAILHDREWTYSVILPHKRSPGRLAGAGVDKGHHEWLYRAVHQAVRDGLRQLGWDASLAEHCTCSIAGKLPVATKDPFLCFQRRTPVDLVVGAHKVQGSAQRRSRTGLLQHGSLLLSASGSFPSILGLEDLMDGNFFSEATCPNSPNQLGPSACAASADRDGDAEPTDSKDSEGGAKRELRWAELLAGWVRKGVEEVV